MRTFKFQLYNHKRNRHLHRQIDGCREVYNHCIKLHRRYYRLTGKYLNYFKLKKHITKLKKLPKYSHWNDLASQAIQDQVQRIDKGYKLFFSEFKKGNKKIRPPRFKKRWYKQRSFTLTQAGYKFLEGNYVRIGDNIYRYFKSREIEGPIKTLTIKRDSVKDLYIIAITDALNRSEIKPISGKIAGFDFGLRTFLTASDGSEIESPLFFKRGQKELAVANRNLSRKKKGSRNRYKARTHYARTHRKIKRQREDYHWKLAHKLTDAYDALCFETLNIDGMKRLWGKKVSDLAFYSFMLILKYIAGIKGVAVIQIGQWYPSSKTCSVCSWKYADLEKGEYQWTCQDCHTIHDRDLNAAINIERVGASTLQRGDIRPVLTDGQSLMT